MSDFVKLTSVGEIVEAAYELYSKYGGPPWWRGHGAFDWKLVPKVHREGRGHQYEKNIALRFRHRAGTRYPKCPDYDDGPAWVFLMQHYGLPTRLVDWTESVLVAAFFAVQEDEPKDAALWGLNPAVLNEHQCGVRGPIFPGHSSARRVFSAVFQEGTAEETKIIAVEPNQVDPRVMIQQSMFTIHSDKTPLDSNAASGDFLAKFRIPEETRIGLRHELYIIGIHESTLFPDLEHLARDLASMVYTTEES